MKASKKFSLAISYEEHLKGAEKTFQNEVLPLLKRREDLKKKNERNVRIPLIDILEMENRILEFLIQFVLLNGDYHIHLKYRHYINLNNERIKGELFRKNSSDKEILMKDSELQKDIQLIFKAYQIIDDPKGIAHISRHIQLKKEFLQGLKGNGMIIGKSYTEIMYHRFEARGIDIPLNCFD